MVSFLHSFMENISDLYLLKSTEDMVNDSTPLAIVPEPAFSRNYPNQTTLGRLQEVGLHPQGG